jgi:hypothetical protein
MVFAFNLGPRKTNNLPISNFMGVITLFYDYYRIEYAPIAGRLKYIPCGLRLSELFDVGFSKCFISVLMNRILMLSGWRPHQPHTKLNKQ